MAIGNYGTVRPADVSPTDIEVILHYTESRDVTSNFTLEKLDSTQVLRPYFSNSSIGGSTSEILGGLYNMTLPSDKFNNLGIYTVMLRPTQIRTQITDCGILSALPNVKGIVIDLNNVSTEFKNKFVPQGLVGFRIEYLNDDGSKVPNFFRIVTSNFYCEAVTQNQTNTLQQSIRYRYTDEATNLVFCTLTPSSSTSNRPTVTPYIGVPGQNIIVTHTFFNPSIVEVEIVEHDASTLAIALYGNQTKSIDDGIYTIYDSDNNIYQQYNLYEIRDQFNELLYEVRQNRGNNIDFSKNFNQIIA
jgi:hypothetical protein